MALRSDVQFIKFEIQRAALRAFEWPKREGGK